jgi:hypothetical protein
MKIYTNIMEFNKQTIKQIIDRLKVCRQNPTPSDLAIFNPTRGDIRAVFADTVDTQKLIRNNHSDYVCTLKYTDTKEQINDKLIHC